MKHPNDILQRPDDEADQKLTQIVLLAFAPFAIIVAGLVLF